MITLKEQLRSKRLSSSAGELAKRYPEIKKKMHYRGPIAGPWHRDSSQGDDVLTPIRRRRVTLVTPVIRETGGH
jgi:hypothetical protein